MALESLGAISSTFVAGPSGKKSKEKEKTDSGAKKNPFDTTQVEKNPLALANFNKYKSARKLEEHKCDEHLDFNCQSTYVYRPDSKKIEQCDDLRKSLNIPEDYGFCDGTPLLTRAKTIKAEDLEKFVGLKNKK